MSSRKAASSGGSSPPLTDDSSCTKLVAIALGSHRKRSINSPNFSGSGMAIPLPPWHGIFWITLGGLFYIAGIVFYAFDRLSFFNAFWHLSNYARRKPLSLHRRAVLCCPAMLLTTKNRCRNSLSRVRWMRSSKYSRMSAPVQRILTLSRSHGEWRWCFLRADSRAPWLLPLGG